MAIKIFMLEDLRLPALGFQQERQTPVRIPQSAEIVVLGVAL